MNLPIESFEARGQTWPIDSSPLPGGPSSNYRQTRIARRTDELFVVAPSWESRFGGLIALGMGLGIYAAFVVGVWQGWLLEEFLASEFWTRLWIVVCLAFGWFLGGVCLWMGLRFLTRSTRFDKAAGRVVQRSIFRTGTDASLDDVLAVQVVVADGTLASYGVAQVNLVMAIGEPRLNVCSEPTAVYVRFLAGELSTFLNVTLLDPNA